MKLIVSRPVVGGKRRTGREVKIGIIDVHGNIRSHYFEAETVTTTNTSGIEFGISEESIFFLKEMALQAATSDRIFCTT